MVQSLMVSKKDIWRNPSTAEVTEMGGVIIPSAINAAPPSMAGNTSQRFCLLTNAYKEKIPPSPLLSAFKVRMTYFIVVCRVSVQMIQDKLPMINKSPYSALTGACPLQMAFITYSGDVPMS